MVIVVLLVVVFGPGKAVGMARDLGRLASGARDHVEEFKDELLSPPAEDGAEDSDDEDEVRGQGSWKLPFIHHCTEYL
jgi:Sec-independent protein translocase protein TatA